MKNKTTRFSVAGPDGSGKSTICETLSSFKKSSEVIHAVKDRNLHFISTKLGARILSYSQRKNYLLYTFVLYFVFYPLEFIENLYRFSRNGKDFYIYDRHPIDRMALRYELLLRFKKGRVNLFRFYYEYPLRVFWSELYRLFFRRIDKIYVLLPEAELSYERASGQYKSMVDAVFKVDSYKLSAIRYMRYHRLTRIDIKKEDTVGVIVNKILQDINNIDK